MKTWLITGATRGFGRIWAETALGRGDRVAIGAGNPAAADDLAEKFPDTVVPIQMDVTQPERVRAAVMDPTGQLGGLDVLVNNADYGLFGFVEETNQEEAHRQMNTNFFGALWTSQAALETGAKGSAACGTSSCPRRPALSNVEYASLGQITGWSPVIAPEVINSAAPDIGNIKILHLFGTP